MKAFEPSQPCRRRAARTDAHAPPSPCSGHGRPPASAWSSIFAQLGWPVLSPAPLPEEPLDRGQAVAEAVAAAPAAGARTYGDAAATQAPAATGRDVNGRVRAGNAGGARLLPRPSREPHRAAPAPGRRGAAPEAARTNRRPRVCFDHRVQLRSRPSGPALDPCRSTGIQARAGARLAGRCARRRWLHGPGQLRVELRRGSRQRPGRAKPPRSHGVGRSLAAASPAPARRAPKKPLPARQRQSPRALEAAAAGRAAAGI